MMLHITVTARIIGKTWGTILVGISNLLAVATTFTGSGNLYCQWKHLTWQWECLVYFIPNMNEGGGQVDQVHVLDFEGLTEDMRQGLTDRLRMVYTWAEGHVLFTSHAWRRLFEIQGHWIAFDRDFLEMVPSYTSIRDPLRRLCYRLIAMSIFGRGQAPDKVTATDLFYLRSMDEGTAVNVPYLLARYLFRHAEGRKHGARMLSGHFVGCLAEHFGLAWVAAVPERQQVATTGATQANQEILEEGVQDDPAPVQAPQAPAGAPATRTMP
nr:hypothetical protein [Tanacetum cinerariifolium]